MSEESTDTNISRRQVVGAAGVTALGVFIGTRAPVTRFLGATDASAANCVSLTPAKTIGPYFVEEKLNRSNITTDPATGTAVAGIPLTLNWTLLDEDKGCAPVQGAQVDIWHARPDGKYTDESGEGTIGNKALRGYQVSDANGKVSFTTVYPGWYNGRTVHIHMRVRVFDSSGKASYDFVSQVFFDDALSDSVYAAVPYAGRGSRNTRNSADNIYGADGNSLTLSMTGDNDSGYVGTFTFGLSKTGAASGTPGSTTDGDGTSSTDRKVGASLASGKVVRTALGNRLLQVKVRNTEAVALKIKLKRGSKTLKSKTVSYKRSATHTIKVPLGSRLASGRATLEVTVIDAAGNSKVLHKTLRVPRHNP